MRLYFPESEHQVDYVGYNHAIKQFRRVVERSGKASFVTDPGQADYRVYCNLPWHHNAQELRTRHRLPLMVYTMYESTRLPSGWVRWLNRNAEVVLVPSTFCEEVFWDSGVRRPMHILPLGYDPDITKPVPKTRATESYVFMWQGVALDLGGRKGADIALDAFAQAKHEKLLGADALLIIKVRPNRVSRMVIDGLNNSDGVYIFQDDMPREKLQALYEHVDCCINPTHGEGFGLIPLEQMAMGKPVLVTGWSIQYAREPFCRVLPHELKPSPVTWNHRFVSVGANGLAWNAGGLMHDLRWVPQLIRTRRDYRSIPLGPGPHRPMGFWRGRWNRAVNAVADFQQRHHLFSDPRRKMATLYQEFPGMDAHVPVEALKEAMVWAYTHREEAAAMGQRGARYAAENWTLHRMEKAWCEIVDTINSQRGA